MSAVQEIVSPDQLHRLLRYEGETGLLYWRPRDHLLFTKPSTRSAQAQASYWNARYAETVAFGIQIDGYRRGSIYNLPTTAHRVVWAMCHGAWPEMQIDHVNGIRSDNRLLNLRLVSPAENAQNLGLRNNSSGITGVSQNTKTGKWIAQISVNKRNTYLGSFETKAEAEAVRQQASLDYGYHPNHGNRRRAA